MSTRFFYLWAIACLLSCVPARADDVAAGNDDIPVVGRPAGLPFSGASGDFAVESKAEPTTLRADEPITFTLTVRARGAVRHPPRRPDLRELPAFSDRFFIDDVSAEEPSTDAGTREFVYRLKARRADVSDVPEVPFVYLNPAIRPASKGFQICFTDAIPLKLQAAEAYISLPTLSDAVYTLADGPGLLAPDPRSSPPSPVLPGFILAVPPTLCAAWYIAWCGRHPDAGRQLRRRRSRAAKESLRLLRAARWLPLPRRAGPTADALAHYLRERFELAAADPTPSEAAGALRKAGCAAPLADAAARFVAACDAARFTPTANGAALNGEAVRLILDVEADTWAWRHS
jgi:hypothetical protein